MEYAKVGHTHILFEEIRHIKVISLQSGRALIKKLLLYVRFVKHMR